ncbi:MAG: SDR family NAD(P)-dependent oxidoreductase, partial [Myxococcota bacterium]
MSAAIRIPTFLLGVIGLLSGAASVWGGIPEVADIVDNTHRFYAGIWFAVGFGLIHAAVRFESSEHLFGFLMRALIVGGIARAIGLLDYPPEPKMLVAIGIEVVVPIVLLKLRARLAKRSRQTSLVDGRSVLVTGANGGLGRQTVAALVEDGVSRIVMAVRTRAKGEAARDQVRAEGAVGPETALEVAEGFDMTDPKKITAAVDALPADRRFDIVFLQAGGVVFSDEVQTVAHKGHTVERTVFQNVFGAHVVLSRLVERGLLAPGARVVFAGGEGARGIPGLIEKPVFETAEALHRYIHAEADRPYNPMNAIGVSKLVGALWTTKLAQIYGERMSVLWFSPGLTGGTQGLSGAPAARRFLLEKIGFPVMTALGLAQTPEQGARKNADALLGKVGRNGDVIGAP